MKKLLLLLAMAIMVIGLVAGCGKSADNGGDKKSGTIGFSVSTLNNPFFVTMKEGVEAQAKALGLKVKIVDAQNLSLIHIFPYHLDHLLVRRG